MGKKFNDELSSKKLKKCSTLLVVTHYGGPSGPRIKPDRTAWAAPSRPHPCGPKAIVSASGHGPEWDAESDVGPTKLFRADGYPRNRPLM